MENKQFLYNNYDNDISCRSVSIILVIIFFFFSFFSFEKKKTKVKLTWLTREIGLLETMQKL